MKKENGIIPICKGCHAVSNGYPYCTGVIITGDRTFWIDPGWPKDILVQASREYPPDVIINTHYHVDHTYGNRFFPKAEVWAHEMDAAAMESEDGYLSRQGLRSAAQDYHVNRYFHGGFQPCRVTRILREGDLLDLGSMALKVLHTPGHTEGHCSFWDEQKKLLIAGDIDLCQWGPWYGYKECSVDDFLSSIEKLRQLHPELAITGHGEGGKRSQGYGIYQDDIDKNFLRYRDIILNREENIVRALETPMTEKELTDKRLIYGETPKAYLWLYELQMNRLHLKRLMRSRRVVQSEDGRYQAAKAI